MDQEPGLGLDIATPKKAEAYRVLARKYRPQDFTGLIGQEALVKTLSNAFSTGRIAHAFMLTGVRGVGKTTTARIIARALNCIGPDGKRTTPTIQPCGVCDPCVSIAESRCVDVQEMDGASNNGIEEVRQIIDSVRYAPAMTRYKVYIIDEVHMLSKPAFNALLKTLEEPPQHVEFVFATTELRKVPVTILSRCQKFDLRRIETVELVGLLKAISEKENVGIEDAALALVARAAEGSARDALSLLDQAIAHGDPASPDGSVAASEITAEAVRGMLGLADRGRILDLFEKLMGGKLAEALTDLNELYDRGADPLAVVQDLLETTHFLTRVRVAPNAEGFFDGSGSEGRRAAEMAAKLPVAALTRAWQMLLKGLIEVRDATRPIAACEMALIRLSYAADLPPTDKLVRDVLDGGSAPAPRGAAPAPSSSSAPRAMSTGNVTASAQRAPQPTVDVQNAPTLRTLEDVVALAAQNGAPILKVHLENDVHLVRLEPGIFEFRPSPRAPSTLAGDLKQKLRDWTGVPWSVSIAREGGEPTISEQKKSAKAARLEIVMQQPLVRAVFDRFPGAEIVAVRDVLSEDVAAPMPEDDA